MNAELIRVLVAVDDPTALAIILDSLPREHGFEAVVARTSGEATAAIEGGELDAILLDLALPDSEGLRTITLPAEHERGRPVIILAPPALEKKALRAVHSGCTDYILTSDLAPAMVSRAIRYAVDTCRAERRWRQAERALVESEQRYRSLFEQSRDAIYMTERTGAIVEVNQAAIDLSGYDLDDLLGRNVLTIYADPADRERFRTEIEARGHVRDFEVLLRRGDGEERWCLVSAWVRRDPDGTVRGYQGIIHDITARKEVEQQLAHEAFHDGLTNLPNRALFMDRLERAVARRRRGEERDLAVLFLDLDRFKVVNDSLGHMAGDSLLRQLARVLQEHVREEDTVARIGGDEFAILLDGVDDPADPTHVAERIQERLRAPFRINGQDVFTSVSIGITFGGARTEMAEDLLRDADTAMYRAKELGPARYQIFDERMHAHAITLLQLETDMRLALERQDFVLHYQPLVDLSDDRLLGFEALIRWQHPQRGLLPPQAFIPIAEDTGLIVPMGEWVLRTATRTLHLWQEHAGAPADLYVAVNVARRQLSRPDLAGTVRDILQESGLPPESLRLELTESVLMHHPESTLDTLLELREMGVRLCIDDFGTGYSSLDYLHDLPIDSLKIDRSFIRRLEDGDGGSHIVATIVALARNLGLHTVAEGVETESQLEFLRDLGPGTVQGFLLSEPLDEEAAGILLRDALARGGLRGAGQHGRH